MLRSSVTLAFLCVGAAVGCGERGQAPSVTGTGKGVAGQYYYVNLFTPPVGGIVSSDVGGISCGASGVSVNNAVDPPQYVYAYYATGTGPSSHCGQTRFAWAQAVTLTASGQGPNTFLGWAGDCSGAGTCTLTAGADKTVVAIFGPPGSGHPSFIAPAVHGPAYFAFLSGASALDCARCHGADLAGQGIAPGCNGCHARAGWASWQGNCSFCHGARTAAAKAGYTFSAHPAWAAPPDALSQRFTGAPAPDRSGAHQAHLLGLTPSGLSVAPAFACATCHPVPTDLTHVSGAGARAQVVLSGAGQASLPASLGVYDQASGTCATYCHGAGGSPTWSATNLTCSGCHGIAPQGSHPYQGNDLTTCADCHGESVDADGSIRVGGAHLDGAVQATGGHADFTSPAVHGPAFLDWLGGVPGGLSCSGCHGATYGGGLGPSCNGCHAANGWTGWQTNCSFCHGTSSASTRAGYSLAANPTWAAPPDAIAQRLDPAHAAVPARTGAHQAHLSAGAFTAAFACSTCHPVPNDLTHVGGSTSRATVALVGTGQRSFPASLGTYDQASGTCATSCHGAGGSPAWSSSPAIACGACHSIPPSTASGHPDVSSSLTGCAVCHPGTMNADGTIDLAGGRHLDGVVQASGMHGSYASPATHGPAFFDFLAGRGALDCSSCHGATSDGGVGPSCNACHASAGWTGWQTNCSFCHGARDAGSQAGYGVATHPTWSAPPDAIAQRLDPAHAAVPARTGAHQAHLTGLTAGGQSFAPAFSCATCHAVPADLSHIGGSTSRATVALAGAGQAWLAASLGTYDPATGSCATYCHGSSPSPAWATPGVVCGSCHALPPSTASGHPDVPSNLGFCSICHPTSVNADGTIRAGGTHLDGASDASGMHGDYASPATHGPRFFDSLAGTGSLDCQACHGATYGGGGVGPSCTACHQASGWTGWQTNCSFCHGATTAAAKAGYVLAASPTWSAPPDALAQRLDPAHAAVPARTGAHQVHLTGGPFAGAFSCATCHAVPADVSHIGGSTSRATVALAGAGQATLPASLGTYSPATGSCATYCHGSSPSPAWATTGVVCGSCHALPPGGGHPTVGGGLTACFGCHPDTMNADGTVNVAGGKHLDGAVEAAGHGDFSSPAIHGPQFFSFLRGDLGALTCTGCHGATYGGASAPSCNACHASNGWTNAWQGNCSFCHGVRSASTRTTPYNILASPTLSAPPDALSQRLTGVPDPARTGAHRPHLTGLGSSSGFAYRPPLPCATCHTVPADYAHAGGPGRAPVTLVGSGSLPASLGTYAQATGTCTTYCHGSTMVDGGGAPMGRPAWSSGELGCSGCHGYAPGSGQHDLHVNQLGWWCADCHSATVTYPDGFPQGQIIGNHVNGVANVQFFSPGSAWDGASCTSACHEDGSSRSWR